MKKLTSILLVVLLMLAWSATASAASADPIKLAIVAPLTGDYAEYGMQALNAAKLAADQTNAAGGVLDGRQIEIVSYDDRGMVDEGSAIAEMIAADDSILALPNMDFQSSVALVTGPIYQEAGIPCISNASSHPDYALIGEYVMRNNCTDYDEALNTIEACYLTGARKIAYIGEETDFGVSAGENMKNATEVIAALDETVEWVGSSSFLSGTVDFSAQISELIALKPDIIVNSGTYESFAPFCTQLRRAGSDIRVAGVGNIYDENVISVGGEAVEGVIFPSLFNADSENPVVKKFVTEFEAATGGTMPNHIGSLAYDATMMLINAVKVTGTDNREAVMKSLYTTPYEGVTGSCIFGETHECEKPQVIFEIKDGAFAEIANLLYPTWDAFLASDAFAA